MRSIDAKVDQYTELYYNVNNQYIIELLKKKSGRGFAYYISEKYIKSLI